MCILRSVLYLGLLLVAAPSGMALSERNALQEFQGVWIGKTILADERLRQAAGRASDFDVAIWTTDSGFTMSWKNLDRDGTKRITSQFVASGEPATFEATQIDPASSEVERVWARVEGDRLSVYLSRIGDDGVKRVSRYACSISNGRITFEYTLSSGGELLERVTGNLSRAKVVM